MMRALAAVPTTPGITTECCKACEHTQNILYIRSLQLSPPGYNIRSETLQHPSVRNAWLLAVHDPNQ